jgi:hypothetical protein
MQEDGSRDAIRLTDLPLELIVSIADHLPARDFVSFFSTCKYYTDELGDDGLLWEGKCRRQWPDKIGLRFGRHGPTGPPHRTLQLLHQIVDTSHAAAVIEGYRPDDTWRQKMKRTGE